MNRPNASMSGNSPTKPNMKRLPMVIAVFCFAIFSQLNNLFSQDVVVKDRYDEFFGEKPAISTSFRSDVNLNDVSLGLTVGWVNPSQNLTFYGSFDARPFRKRLLEYAGNNTFYQYRQERYFFGAGVEYKKQFEEEKPFGAFFDMNISYLTGSYAGTSEKPDNGLIITPRLGLFWKYMPGQNLRVGYSYMDVKADAIEMHRLFISFTSLIKIEK